VEDFLVGEKAVK